MCSLYRQIKWQNVPRRRILQGVIKINDVVAVRINSVASFSKCQMTPGFESCQLLAPSHCCEYPRRAGFDWLCWRFSVNVLSLHFLCFTAEGFWSVDLCKRGRVGFLSRAWSWNDNDNQVKSQTLEYGFNICKNTVELPGSLGILQARSDIRSLLC